MKSNRLNWFRILRRRSLFALEHHFSLLKIGVSREICFLH